MFMRCKKIVNSILNLFNIILLFNQIIKASSEAILACDISTTNAGITTQKLNNIICLGSVSNFAHINFAKFSDGTLIVESSLDKDSTIRAFYGITADGKPFFDNNKYTLSLSAKSGNYRKDSENYVITINDGTKSEYLISVGDNLNVELYDLKQKKILETITTKSFINNKAMDSLIQSGLNYYDGTNYFLYHCYLTTDFLINIRRLKFSSSQISTVTSDISTSESYIQGKIASCYMTENNYIVCLAIFGKTPLLYATLYAYVFDHLSLKEQLSSKLGYTMIPNNLRYTYFIKCLHLSGINGVFAFYQMEGKAMVPNLILLFKTYNNKELTDFISEVKLNKKSFNMNNLLNDLIKINDKKLCFFSTSDNKEEMYIVLLNIFATTVIKCISL